MISALIGRDRRKIKIIPSSYFYQNGMILEIKNFFKKMGKLKTSENETIHCYTMIS